MILNKFHLRYIRYLTKSINKFDVHPPFLYDLITNVFEDKKIYDDYALVENLKQELLKNKEIITIEDLGAGSTINKSNQRTIKQIAKNSSKSKKYGRLLYRLVHYYKPETILELGTSLGLSSAYMALANPASRLATIEGSPEISAVASSNFEKLKLQNIDLITGNFDEKLPACLNLNKSLDFIFVDGNHRYEPTIKYFSQCLSNINVNSIIVFDDIHWSDGMEKAWEYIINHPDVTLSVDIFFLGIIFLKKELTKQHFVVRF